jgi:hypothetical protein
VHRISTQERRARVARRHLLAPEHRATDPAAVARAVVALHSSEAASVFLSVFARTAGVAASDVERSLYEERALVRMLGMRRTLFVVPRDLVPVVYAACTRTIAARERRRLEGLLRNSGISKRPDAWLMRAGKAALAALDDRGEAFTSDLAKDVPALGKRIRLGAGTRFETTQSAAARVLPQLAMEGVVVRSWPRGSWTNGQYRWTRLGEWLGEEPAELEPSAARPELLHRWLAAFGPGAEGDLRWWTGWTARETREALGAVAHVKIDLGGVTGLILEDDIEPVEMPEPAATLLPTLDPTTMGWKERDWYLGDQGTVLFDRNGNAGPTVWWEGRIIGGWAQRRDGEIVYRLLEDVGSEAVASVEAEAARLGEWIGAARISPTFLPPFQRSLTA